MPKGADRTHFALLFDLGDRWEQGRRDAKRARRSTGRTSIAVTKETAMQLRSLASRLRVVGGWSIGFLSLDELLAALAKGNVAIVTAAGRKEWTRELAKKGKRVTAATEDMQNAEDDL